MGASMLRHRVSRAAQAAAVALSFLFIFAIVALAQDAPAQDRRQNAPGQFDFYVLALSWISDASERSPQALTGVAHVRQQIRRR